MFFKNWSYWLKGIVVIITVFILIILIYILSIIFSFTGIGIYKDSESPKFNFEKKHLEQKQETYFGTYQEAWIFGLGGAKRDKWLILKSNEVKVSKECFVEYYKPVKEGYNKTYQIRCDIDKNVVCYNCGVGISFNYSKEELLDKGLRNLPSEANFRIKIESRVN